MKAQPKENFKKELAKLKKNDRETIDKLTEIAKDQESHASEITEALFEKMRSVSYNKNEINILIHYFPNSQSRTDKKVLFLYVIDSIIKFVGGKYIQLIETEIPELFASTYLNLLDDPDALKSLRILYAIWKRFFKPDAIVSLRNIIYAQKNIVSSFVYEYLSLICQLI